MCFKEGRVNDTRITKPSGGEKSLLIQFLIYGKTCQKNEREIGELSSTCSTKQRRDFEFCFVNKMHKEKLLLIVIYIEIEKNTEFALPFCFSVRKTWYIKSNVTILIEQVDYTNSSSFLAGCRSEKSKTG